VRWHWALIPNTVDVNSFRLAVRGHVNQNLSLSLDDLMALPRVELVAINQCSGNSRGYFQPRVPGAQWSHGAMGNARWTGVRLKDVLDRAGVKSGVVQVRFNGMDEPIVPDAPDFMKSLAIDHARDGEVMLAYAMNGSSSHYSTDFRSGSLCPAGIPPTGSRCSTTSRCSTNPTQISG
jgi:DMSO/TMAO reductase YedYZ molybdopterin-dependent catalytic subunit